MTTAMLAPSQQVGPLSDLPVHVELGYYPEGAAVSRWDLAKWDVAGGGQWAGVAPREDITCNVTRIDIHRGRDMPLERFRPSSATLEVYDPDGRWSPWRTAAAPATYTTVRPGIDVYIWVDRGAGVHTNRFVGIVDAIVDTFPDPTVDASHTVTFQLLDYLSVLAAYDGVEQAAVGSGELAGPRLTRITNNAGYTGPRTFDAGTIALQATTLAKNALDEAGITVDTEQGAFWCTRDGTLMFRDRNGLGLDAHYTTVQATFGEVAPEICYVDVALASDLQKTKNIVSVANVGGTAATRSDTASVSLYKPRTYKRTDLINLNGSDNGLIAQRHLDFYAYAQNRIDALDIDLLTLTRAQRLQVLDLGALWRIQVRRRAEGFQVVADLQIQGITERITASSWTISFATFSASAVFAVGRWDHDTWNNGLWGY